MFCIDSATKFYRGIRIGGWLHQAGNPLQAVRLKCRNLLYQHTEVGIEHLGVASLGANKGFSIQALLAVDGFPDDAVVEFQVKGEWISAPLVELLKERVITDESAQVERRFIELLKQMPGRPKMLDIGGRDRSLVDRSKSFPYADVTVVDILAGQNVDVVGDAHNLSALFEPESFDAVYSVSVFEHLLMPWKAALEINKVLKPGGIGMIFTHQTLGMHEEPWDFWRYSAHSWDALFNAATGFEIEDRSQSMLNYILPMLYRDGKQHAERAAGFEASIVLIRKTGATELEWNVPLSNIIATTYPAGHGAS
ncbi:MAG: class I SAM-dependent methyltransferase [Chitinophagales bacterium]|nr:class I SAM-dependent methyltransferase [Hyphomicrobiales bacterium]